MRYLFLLFILVFSGNSRAQELWTLQDLINYAIKNSPSLIQSRIDVEIAGLDEDVAFQNRLFGFTLDAGVLSGIAVGRRGIVIGGGGAIVSEELGGDTLFVQPFGYWHFFYPLFKESKFIFQRSIPEEIAEVNYKQSENSYKVDKQEVIFSIGDLFLQIVSKRKELEYMNQNIARLSTILGESKERFENRLITEADLMEVELKLTDAQTNMKLAEMDLDILKKQLSNLIGMPLNQEPPDLEYDLTLFENMNSLIPELNALRSWSLEQNPKLSIANLDVKEAKLNLRLVNSSIFPILFLTESSVLSTEDSTHFAGLGISFPIGEIFKRLIGSPQVAKIKLTVEKNEVNLKSVQSSVEFGLMQAYMEWKKARESAIGASKKVKVTEARVNEGKNRLKFNLITIGGYLEYLTSYEEAYLGFEEKKRDEYTKLLSLLKNVGVIDRYLAPNTLEKKEEKSELETAATKQEAFTLPTEERIKLVTEKKMPVTNNLATTHLVDKAKSYTVQIGAFQDEVEANKLADNLQSKGYPVNVTRTEIFGKGTWYKVRTGTFKTGEEAKVYGDSLKSIEPTIKSVLVTITN